MVYTFAGLGVLGLLAAGRTDGAELPAARDVLPGRSVPPEQHPLQPVVAMARDYLQRIDNEIPGYTCRLVKRERIGDRLRTHEFALMKLRHRQIRQGRVVVPFSVYMRYLEPSELAGREVVLVEDRHQGKLIARRGGPRLPYMTMAVDPQSDLAMRDNRYPITEIGIRNMIRKLLEVGEEELHYGETEVKYFTGATVDGRSCTVMEVRHPVRRDHFRYHVARVFVDDELRLPIRYASYDWPEEEGGRPRLLEEYTYLDLKLNVALSDRDFDYRNPAYGFREDFRP